MKTLEYEKDLIYTHHMKALSSIKNEHKFTSFASVNFQS